MFGFLKKVGKVNSLEKIAQELEMNMSNNYKDAAQENFREFVQTLSSRERLVKRRRKIINENCPPTKRN